MSCNTLAPKHFFFPGQYSPKLLATNILRICGESTYGLFPKMLIQKMATHRPEFRWLGVLTCFKIYVFKIMMIDICAWWVTVWRLTGSLGSWVVQSSLEGHQGHIHSRKHHLVRSEKDVLVRALLIGQVPLEPVVHVEVHMGGSVHRTMCTPCIYSFTNVPGWHHLLSVHMIDRRVFLTKPRFWGLPLQSSTTFPRRALDIWL